MKNLPVKGRGRWYQQASAACVGDGALGEVSGPAVVLGAGGSARAAVDALRPDVTIVNRTRARAEALAREMGVKAGGPDAVRSAANHDVGLVGPRIACRVYPASYFTRTLGESRRMVGSVCRRSCCSRAALRINSV